MFEIVCPSLLSDFDSHEWCVGREYDRKIVADIEFGLKNWENLNNCIDPSGWAYAKQMVPEKDSYLTNCENSEGDQKICTTYNKFRKQGCHFEFKIPDKSFIKLS